MRKLFLLLFLLLPLTLQAQFIPDSIDFDLDHDSAGTRIEFRMWSGDWQFIIQDTVDFTPTFSYAKFDEDLIYERSLKRLANNTFALRIEHQADSVQLRYAGKEMTSRFGIFIDTLQVKSDRLVIESKAYLSNLIQEKTFVMAVNGANYFEIEVDATQVPSDLTNPVLFVDFSDLGGAHGFWSNVAADGSDIRVTRDDGSTELPFDVRAIDTGANTGHMFFRDDSTLSSTANTTFRVYYNSGDSAYADTETFGRNNVYQDYLTVLPLSESGNGTAGEFDDYTGNNTTGTGGGGSGTATPTQTSADMPFSGGTWNLFDGSNDHVEIDNSIDAYEGTNLTLQAIFKPEGDGSDESGIIDKFTGGDASNRFQLNFSNDGADTRNTIILMADGSNTDEQIGTTEVSSSTGSTFWLAGTYSASSIQVILDGNLDVDISSPTTDISTWAGNGDPATIGSYEALNSLRSTNAKIGEVRIRGEQLSQDWFQMEKNNQSNSATFYTLSAEQSVTITGDPQAMNVSTSLDTFAGVKNAVGSLNELSTTPTLETIDGTITAIGSPNEMSVATTLDTFAGIKNAVGSPNAMAVSVSLESFAGALQAVGSPDEMSVSTFMEQITINIVGEPESMSVATSLDQFAGTITAVGSLDDMNVATQLEQFSGTITAVGSLDDMSVATLMDQVVGGTQGSATSMDLSANELYVIELLTNKLYKVTLNSNKQYNITLSANEIQD